MLLESSIQSNLTICKPTLRPRNTLPPQMTNDRFAKNSIAHINSHRAVHHSEYVLYHNSSTLYDTACTRMTPVISRNRRARKNSDARRVLRNRGNRDRSHVIVENRGFHGVKLAAGIGLSRMVHRLRA